MSRNFDAEIEEATRVLESIKSEMESVVQQFKSATAEFAAAWYWQETERVVKDKAEMSKELGVEKLSQLKAGVKALEQDAAKIVSEFLDVDSLWWHRTREDRQRYDLYGYRTTKGVDYAVRLALGRLAPILEKFGYLPASGDRDAWREWDSSGNYHPPKARPYYPYGLDWTERMKSLLTQYTELCKKALTAETQLAKVKGDKRRTEAEDLWKKA
jgi:hypothetical protein